MEPGQDGKIAEANFSKWLIDQRLPEGLAPKIIERTISDPVLTWLVLDNLDEKYLRDPEALDPVSNIYLFPEVLHRYFDLKDLTGGSDDRHLSRLVGMTVTHAAVLPSGKITPALVQYLIGEQERFYQGTDQRFEAARDYGGTEKLQEMVFGFLRQLPVVEEEGDILFVSPLTAQIIDCYYWPMSDRTGELRRELREKFAG